MANHIDLRLVEPKFDDPLTDAIMELEHLKRRELYGTTSPGYFFDLKGIFHLLESVGSSRIEGNHTTIYDVVESRVTGAVSHEERFLEIENIEKAMTFVENEITPGGKLRRSLISEVHRIVVDGLSTEGDPNPGKFRAVDVAIAGSSHVPPPPTSVPAYMDELLNFANASKQPKYSLIRTAVAHHRFAWIHPFRNGNGRVVRLLTYAMLIQEGFRVSAGRLINPSAVFCSDRDGYYENLAQADKGTDEGLLTWCRYVLTGLRVEIEKIDRLLDISYLHQKILRPAIDECLERREIHSYEAQILHVAAKNQYITAKDVIEIMPDVSKVTVSRRIKRLREKNMLRPKSGRERQYRISFTNNVLMRALMNRLASEGFVGSLAE